jgi:hypothetical protein
MFILIQLVSSDATGNRTRYIPSCSILPQPTDPPRPPVTPLGIEPTTFDLVIDSTGNTTHDIPACDQLI